MADSAVIKEVQLTLELKAADIELEAAERVSAVATSIGMSADKVDEVRMAVVEACINAVEHSGSDDGRLFLEIAVLGPSKKNGGDESLRVTIGDHGVGFDPGKLVKPEIGKKLKSANKRGWGLKIIEGLMDHVDVRSGVRGTSVVMSKNR